MQTKGFVGPLDVQLPLRCVATCGTDVTFVTCFAAIPNCAAAFGFEPGKAVPLACIRQRFDPPWVNHWYPAQCAALVDGGEDY